MTLLFIIAAAPVTPPQDPPVEVCLFKDALAGKEAEIEETDEEGEDFLQYLAKPEFSVNLEDLPATAKPMSVARHRKDAVVSKVKVVQVVHARYNRRGVRNK